MVIDKYTKEINLKDKGVYLISHKDTNLVYVGSTYQKEGFAGRWRQHLLAIRKKIGNVVLCRICDKYGIDGLEFSILERMNNSSEKEIRQRESYYINLYDSYRHGANMSESTDCSFRVRKHFPNTPEKCQLYKDTCTTKKPMYVYDGEGNLVYTFESGVDADRFFGLKKGATADKARNGWSYYGQYWFSREIKDWSPANATLERKGQLVSEIIDGHRIYRKKEKKPRYIRKDPSTIHHSVDRIKVNLCYLDGTVYKTFESLTQCDDFLGLTRGTTSKVMKGKNHAKTLRKKYIPKRYVNTVLTN